MSRAAKVCGHPSCPNVAPCPEHQRKPWQGSTRRQRLPGDWERRRRIVLARDPICRDGRACNHQALSVAVDHIVNGDDHSLANLQGICTRCHAEKTKAEAAAARRAHH